jgi:hypothetical protein
VKAGNCPGCGAPVEFAAGAGKVKVCEHCSTVVLRGDAKLESLGKVADLVDTDSPLKVGLSGRVGGQGFRIAGRIQKTWGEGTWDEWCLAMDDGRTAWLSESEGAWNLMEEVGEVQVPAFEQLKPLLPISMHGKRYIVEEVGEASTVSAEGQLPDFAQMHRYADSTGPGGAFASLDYGGERPELFVGRTLTLDELGFDKNELSSQPKRAALSQARCTQCNGPLELKAPDVSKRVGCPYCGALLDVSNGKLAFLQLLGKPKLAARIPLGTRGRLKDVEWTCLAFLTRSCTVEGTRYPWEEYLLWNREQGFRWLMMSNGHWTFLTPIAAGDVVFTARNASLKGTPYRQYQTVMATTEQVQGECYWEVTAGEQAFAVEYVAPPYSLNIDQTRREATLTHGEMLKREDVQNAFNLKQLLPYPMGVASAQVNPWRERASSAWKWMGVWAVGFITVFIVFTAMATTGQYMQRRFEVPPDAKPGSPETMTFSAPFEIPNKVPLTVDVTCPDLSNSWCGVQVDLVNEETDEVVSVYEEPSYYFGSDSDGSWSEGGTHESKSTDEVEKGRYVVRLTSSWDPAKPISVVDVGVSSSGPNACCLFFFLLVLAVWPGFATISSNTFEKRRWQDSVFQPQRFTS